MKARRSNALLAQRANLPLAGEVRGIITIVQEDRFRLEDEQGHGFLFTLGRQAGASMADLHRWNDGRVLLTVRYEGPPDLGAVARRVQARSDPSRTIRNA
jgi:hypothetical protein